MYKNIQKTEKIYYRSQYLKCCRAKVVNTSENWIELDKTIAYPEGGGQEFDTGWMETPCGILNFCSVKLVDAIPIELENFKGGKSGGRIIHKIEENNIETLSKISKNVEVFIYINTLRREKLTLSHSASHFLYAAILNFRPEMKHQTIGCHIKEDAARFDFLSEIPFLEEDVEKIENYANELILKNKSIYITSHPENSDARTWIYEEINIPCGGTHLSIPKNIGTIKVSRKKIGKNKERLICNFENAIFDISTYHENDRDMS